MIYNFKGLYGCKSRCELEVIGNVAIVTETEGNPGTSVTNAVETLAAQICKEYNIKPIDLHLIEHYPERGRGAIPETFDRVSFEAIHLVNGLFVSPTWNRMSKDDVEGLRRSGNA
jgi:hypothetical protein